MQGAISCQPRVGKLNNPCTVYRNTDAIAPPATKMAIGYCRQCLGPTWRILMGCWCDNFENGLCTNANKKATFGVQTIFSELIISLRLKPAIQPVSSSCIVILRRSISTRREAAAYVCQSRGKGLKYVSQIGDLTKITIFLYIQ